MGADESLSSYLFDLPAGLIAQRPAERRDASRLMLLPPDGDAEGRVFSDLPEILRPGDILIRNDARVMPARLVGRRRGGGAAELLLVRRDAGDGREVWRCLARPGARFKPNREFSFGDGDLTATVLENDGAGGVRVAFSRAGEEFLAALGRHGLIPLPPYISRPGKRPTPEDNERYQTHYAASPGAVAAPTAGLHFTPELDGRLAARGVETAGLTLNVGPGTFRPVKAAALSGHVMDHEWFRLPGETWRKMAAARRRGGRVVAVGTTAARALEAAALLEAEGKWDGERDLEDWTNLFIRPGHAFRTLDGLITNFHLPGSSLLVLAAALAGRERVLAAYARAIRERYRFYSYGDAMLMWRPDGEA